MSELSYKGHRVDSIREFNYGSHSMAEIIVNNERYVVKRNEIKDVEFETIGVMKPNGVFREEQPKKESKSVKQESANVVEDSTNKETTTVIVAINNTTGEETVLGTQESQTFNDFVKENKLNIEAIDHVLNGKQKTHKGYTFVQQ
ncbi:hypothetical protein JXA27_06830 [Aerococcaceae bacterium zg-B36]|uniref:hypothetical protein n=1 Tax=Aerococcaceae bacterium zg-252 TaxID=2796928 RepID=UPI001BD80FE3|nr:hypothetical protein [Aerococcaceae bacterium zg-B36]